MSEALDALAALIQQASGLRLEQSRHPALRAALARGWPGLVPSEILSRAVDPVTGHAIVATLIDEVTIKETSFLRDRRQLESIDWQDLYATARASGSSEIRVWSAACATGEEPYSLAMLACESFASTAPPVSILATDVSAAALAAAAEGRYRDRAVQGVEEPLRSRYLARDGEQLVVIPALRPLVELAPHNLISDSFPPSEQAPFDLILCRNVLIYFDAETSARVVAGLESALRPGGRLVLGAADALCVIAGTGNAQRELPRWTAPAPRAPRPMAPARREQAKPRPTVLPTTSELGEDLMDPDVHYVRGLVELESGDAAAAVSSLRRVLYLDPEFELAAFALGRAHEVTGELDAARRRYEQALRMLESRPEPGERLTGPIDAATVVDACEARLTALTDLWSPTRAAATGAPITEGH